MLSSQTAAKYNAKPSATKSSTVGGGASGAVGGTRLVLSDSLGEDFEARFKRMEKLIEEVPELRAQVTKLEEELKKTKDVLRQAGLGVPGEAPPSSSRMRSKSISAAGNVPQSAAVVASNRQRRSSLSAVPSGTKPSGWGLLDLLGIGAPTGGGGCTGLLALTPARARARARALTLLCP